MQSPSPLFCMWQEGGCAPMLVSQASGEQELREQPCPAVLNCADVGMPANAPLALTSTAAAARRLSSLSFVLNRTARQSVSILHAR